MSGAVLLQLMLLPLAIGMAFICLPLIFEGWRRIRLQAERNALAYHEILSGMPQRPSLPKLLRLAKYHQVALAASVPLALRVNFFAGVAIFAAAWLAPRLLAARMREAHLAAIDRDLPDAVAILVRSVRAQGSLAAAIDDVVAHTRGALSHEFRLMGDEYRLYGLSLETVLARARERVPVEGFRMMASALGISLRSGGDLPVVLEGIARSTRELSQLQNKIATESAQIRGQMKVMIPAAAGALLLSGLFTKGAYQFIFASFWGNVLLVVICLIQLLAWWWVRRILRQII
jgi:tight adherence protein B